MPAAPAESACAIDPELLAEALHEQFREVVAPGLGMPEEPWRDKSEHYRSVYTERARDAIARYESLSVHRPDSA